MTQYETKVVFGSAEARRKDSKEERKIIDKRASVVWLHCQSGKKVYY